MEINQRIFDSQFIFIAKWYPSVQCQKQKIQFWLNYWTFCVIFPVSFYCSLSISYFAEYSLIFFKILVCLFCPFWVNSWNTFVLFCLDSRWWQIPVFFSCLLLPWGNPQRIYYFATFWWPKKFPTHDFLWFTPTEILSECDLKIQKMKIGGNYQIATWFFPLNLEELNHKQKSYSHWNSEYIMKT